MRLLLFLAIGLGGLLAFPLVGWAAPDYANVEETYQAFEKFVVASHGFLGAITGAGSAGATIIRILFLTIAIYVFSMVVAKWMMRQADLFDVVSVVLLILIVSTIQTFYSTITETLHSLSLDLASAIQEPVVGTTDIFFAPAYLHNIMTNISLTPLDLFVSVTSWLSLGGVIVVSGLLSVLAFFTVAWGTWGYVVATLIGWVVIPFLMVPRLAFLFDGWFRFLVGFLVYDVIARLNISLVLVLVAGYFDLPLSAGGVDSPIAMPGLSYAELSGFVTLAVVAIVGLLATGKFAIAIASGVGGAGGAIARATLGSAALARSLK